jgi:hypothetical protein
MHIRRILILAANPTSLDLIRTDVEIREIEEGLRSSKKRDFFTLEKKLAVRPRDLQRAILDVEPSIVHFCGHGKKGGGIFLEDNRGLRHEVPPDGLADLFRIFSEKIECVVLNACFTDLQAASIARFIPYVVGMNSGVGDAAAIRFAIGFYDAIGAGMSVPSSFELAKNALILERLPDSGIPVLLHTKGPNSTSPAMSPISYEKIRFLPHEELESLWRKLTQSLDEPVYKIKVLEDLGLVCLCLGFYKDAARHFTSLTSHAPDKARHHYHLALSLFEGRRPQEIPEREARTIDQHAHRAVLLDKTRAEYLYLLGIVRYGCFFLNGRGSDRPSYDELFRQARFAHYEPSEIDLIFTLMQLQNERLISTLRRQR